jgi:hypothetical protein
VSALDRYPSLDNPAEFWRSGRLWSLWDMLRVYADSYVHLGMYIHDEFAGLFFNDPDETTGLKPRDERHKADLKEHLGVLIGHCETLKLRHSKKMITSRLDDLPQTSREFRLLIDGMLTELKGRLFLHVPPHRASHYESEKSLSDAAKKAFPSAVPELRAARNAYALGLNIASVFHCMRALEHGLRAMAVDVGKTFDIQNWQNIIDEIEAEIRNEAKSLPRGMPKTERLQFLSEAAAQFLYFKDGWRNYVSHGRANYEEANAETVISHVASFFDILAKHLKEQV